MLTPIEIFKFENRKYDEKEKNISIAIKNIVLIVTKVVLMSLLEGTIFHMFK